MKRPLPVVGVRELEAVYADIPAMECKGLCGGSCGPIGMTEIERQRIRDATGSDPSCGTAREGLRCSLLTPDGKCSAYAVRPLICRMWGVEESLSCPHGCQPARVLTAADGQALIVRVARITGFGKMFWTSRKTARAVAKHLKVAFK